MESDSEPFILPVPAMTVPPPERSNPNVGETRPRADGAYSSTPLRHYPYWAPRFWNGMDFPTWMRVQSAACCCTC